MNKKTNLLLVVILLIAGCSTSGNYHTVNIGSGGMYVENGEFRLDGNVSIGIGAQPDANFSEVRVVLYSAEGTVIESHEVGRLSTNPDSGPLKRRVNITAGEIPEYVLIQSPEFWSSSVNIEVLAYQRTSDGYKEYHRARKSQKFPEGVTISVKQSNTWFGTV